MLYYDTTHLYIMLYYDTTHLYIMLYYDISLCGQASYIQYNRGLPCTVMANIEWTL